MAEYTPEELAAVALRLAGGSASTQDEIIAADVTRAYAATLRQQAGRVDEGMVERLQATLNAHLPVEYLHTKSEVRAALTAALAQQGYVKGEVADALTDIIMECEQGMLCPQDTRKLIAAIARRAKDAYHAERARVPEWLIDGLRLIAGEDGNEAASPRAKAAELLAMLAAAPSQRAEVK